MDILIDSHAHLNFNIFDKDREQIVSKCLDKNVWVINVGTNYETSKKAVEIAERYEKGIWASIGLHPINLDAGLLKLKGDNFEGGKPEKEFDFYKYKLLASSKKVVAIGEIGLDYYWRPKGKGKRELFKQRQKELLLEELELADEMELPVIFHCRLAHNDLIKVLKERSRTKNRPIKGVIHSFVGTLDQAKEYLKMGLYLGFNGMIFKAIGGISFEQIIKYVLLEKILIETDSPYLIPPKAEIDAEAVEIGGFKRNTPLFVGYIAQRIAEIKNVSFEEVEEATAKSAKDLFKIG